MEAGEGSRRGELEGVAFVEERDGFVVSVSSLVLTGACLSAVLRVVFGHASRRVPSSAPDDVGNVPPAIYVHRCVNQKGNRVDRARDT